MKHKKRKHRRRRNPRDRFELFLKLTVVLLLLLALYIYDFHSLHAGVLQLGEGIPDPQTSAVVHFIDVGQADAACVTLPGGEVLLIDAGTNASENKLLSYLDKYGIRHIDYAVFTHPHEDHIGGADAVLEACSVDCVILPEAVSSSVTYEVMLDAIAAEGCAVQYATPGNSYPLGDGSFTILGAYPAEENLNDASIILSFVFGNTSFLFTGDAEITAENAVLLRDPAACDADVLKVGHHGSSTSSSALFLAAVSPDVAVISCGALNEYGHPHSETMKRLSVFTDHIFRTDEVGSVRVYSDGERLWVQSER